MRKHRSTLALVGVVVATTVGAGLTLVTGAPPAAAATSGPGVGTPYVASLGDSYISGEAGRWAGNTNESSSEIDALGSTAYFDNATGTAEQIPGCHRSKSAEIQIGGGVGSVNLACSGAKTSTFIDSSGNFKPGIDFYSDSSGRQGQALMLQNFAATHNVRMVMLSIGGNNFNFAGIVQTCVEDWLLSPSWWPDYCSKASSVTSNFSSSNIAAQVAAIRGAIDNIRTAMTDDGYTAAMYTIVVQDYPSPIPNGVRLPVQPERLHPPVRGRLRVLEHRRQLGQRNGAARHQRGGQDRGGDGRCVQPEGDGHLRRLQRPPSL